MRRELFIAFVAVVVLLIVHVAHALPPVADESIATIAILLGWQTMNRTFRWRDVPVLAVAVVSGSWLFHQPPFNTDTAIAVQWSFIAVMMAVACVQAIRRTS